MISRSAHSGSASSSPRMRVSSEGCKLRWSANPRLAVFKALLPWHGDPPPRMMPRSCPLRRRRKGTTIAADTDSTLATWTMLGITEWAASAAVGSISAASTQQRMPRLSKAMASPPKPDQRSRISQRPLKGCAQGNWGRSPGPRQLIGLAACNLWEIGPLHMASLSVLDNDRAG